MTSVKIRRIITATSVVLLSALPSLSYAQEPTGRVSEEEINTQKVFIDASREKILQNYENAAYLFKEVLKRDKTNMQLHMNWREYTMYWTRTKRPCNPLRLP